MNIAKSLCLLICTVMMNAAFAEKTEYPCMIEVAKGTCWKDYAVHFFVTVERIPGEVEVVLKKNEFTKQAEFPCERRKIVAVEAIIDPVIWSGEENENRRFQVNQKWITPYDVSDDTKNWNFQVCFHKDFPSAPTPLTNYSECPCEFPTPVVTQPATK